MGPVWRSGGHGEAELLASCYRTCLALAAANDLRSIAFPAISCGRYRYPVRDAATVALAAMRADSRVADGALHVILSCPDQAVHEAYSDLLAT